MTSAATKHAHRNTHTTADWSPRGTHMATTNRQDAADRYFNEGSRLVDLATTYWDRANDYALDTVDRAAARHTYEVLSAKARSLFKRHDLILDTITQDTPSCEDGAA